MRIAWVIRAKGSPRRVAALTKGLPQIGSCLLDNRITVWGPAFLKVFAAMAAHRFDAAAFGLVGGLTVTGEVPPTTAWRLKGPSYAHAGTPSALARIDPLENPFLPSITQANRDRG